MNAILAYPGGKWRLSKWISSFFPEHKIYLEPYCGSGAVFFNKKPTQFETINDIDFRIKNFFEVCRDQPEEFARAIYFIPYSRIEYQNILEDKSGQEIKLTGESIEDARRFLIRCTQSMGLKLSDRCGWKNNVRYNSSGGKPKHWNKLPDLVFEVAERLKNAQIECCPALELIEKYNQKDCLMYIDPPYPTETRTNRIYKYEMLQAEEHATLLEKLLNHKGHVVISGYENELYNEILKGWRKEVKPSITTFGLKREEVIWMNFNLEEQLDLF